ncbi:hypothetical protein M758_UG076000 [Ceratodon purpureus]|nr:hypothetical protein M758_UG076000 [Ceratodon purpureus]
MTCGVSSSKTLFMSATMFISFSLVRVSTIVRELGRNCSVNSVATPSNPNPPSNALPSFPPCSVSKSLTMISPFAFTHFTFVTRSPKLPTVRNPEPCADAKMIPPTVRFA